MSPNEIVNSMAVKGAQKQCRKPVQARSKATWAIIVEACLRISRTQSLNDLTTNHIAEVAGVGIGTLYDYFRSKDDVILAVARSVLEKDRLAILAAVDASPPEDMISACVKALVNRHITDRAMRRAVMSFHIGRGFGADHVEQVNAVLSAVWAKLSPELAVRVDSVGFFVLSRAVLGVCRALTDEDEGSFLDLEAVELRLIELVQRELSYSHSK